MSENPYVTPMAVDPKLGGKPGLHDKPKMPGMLMAVCIICLILGITGLGGSFFGFLGTVIQAVALNNVPVSDAESRKFFEMQQSTFIPNLVIHVLNFVVAPMLIAGAIGVLTAKRWGRSFFRSSLLCAAIYVVIKAALTVYMQLAFARTMIDEVAANAKGAPKEMSGILESFAYIGIAMLSIVFVVLLAGYVFGLFYMNSKGVKEYCGTFK